MARGYQVRLGDGALGSGDLITGPTIGFHIDTTIGTGSWTWSGVDSDGVTQTDFLDTGTYYLADDGNVYFVPDTLIADDLTSASATTAPAYGGTGGGATGGTAGTAGDDTINAGGSDDILYGGPDSSETGTGSDTINGGAGQDAIFAGDGDDLIEGGADSDVLYGGDGNDVGYGDGQATASTSSQTLRWDQVGAAGTDISGGFSQDTGDMSVMVDFNNDQNQTSVEVSDSTQFTGFGFINPNSSVRITGDNSNNNPQGGVDLPTTTVSLVFTANGGTGLSNEVSDISFLINDIDSGTDGWIDQITVNAYDIDGNPVSVVVFPAFLSDSVSGQTVTAGAGEDTPDSEEGSAQVYIQGPAHYVEIIYTNPGEGAQDIWLTDVEFVTEPASEGSDTLFGGAGDDSLYGGIGNDTVDGGADNDDLYGGVGDDTLEAGSGNDTARGEDGNDTLTATAGTNTLFGGVGDDTVTGGSGTDSLHGEAGNDTLRGEDGTDTLFGGAGDDVMEGGEGDDRLTASSGNDTLFGDAGNDRLFGQNNDDTLYGGDGDDTVDGGTGTDTLFGDAGDDTVYGGAGNDVTDLGAGNDSYNEFFGAQDEGDDTVYGGQGDDEIFAYQGNDSIYGGAGNDYLVLDSSDGGFAEGGSGDDEFFVNGADGDTTVVGGEDIEGNDFDRLQVSQNSTITYTSSEAGSVTSTTGSGTQTFSEIEQVYANDTGSANFGQDRQTFDATSSTGGVNALAGIDQDTMLGSDFADTFDAGSGNDTLDGGAGNDTLIAGTGDDTVTGGEGDDSLYGGAGDDTFRVAPDDGTDTIVGGENAGDTDTLHLYDSGTIQSANVTLTGDESGSYSFGMGTATGTFSEIEAIQTGSGDDTINGTTGTSAAQINTGAGDDSVIGTAGGDSITAGLGADTILGGTGDDRIDLGAGGVNDTDTDVLIVRDGDGNDLITNFVLPTDNGDGSYTGNDLLDVTGTSNFDGTQVDVADVTVFADANGDAVISFPQGVTLTFAGVTPAQIDDPAILAAMGIPVQDQIVEGTDGDDVIDVNYIDDPEGDLVDANDALDASNDDLVLGLGGNDTAYGGAGNDTVYGGIGNDSVIGEEGDDTLFGDEGADFLNGVIGNDTLYGGAGDDFLESGTGNDTAYGDVGNDSLNGDEGADEVYGGAGDDYVRGSFGNDTVYGGTGDDYVWGGYGDDVHVVEDDFGNDTYFGDSEDEILGDTLDLSAVTDELTIDLRDGVPEIGSFTDGTSSATFSEIEHIVLGSGTDTLQLADNSGGDRVEGFTAPTLQSDGTYTPGDLLDVTELTSDFGSTPVTVADVTLTDDGSGNAVLSFPGGESLTLVGVPLEDISSPLALSAMGIPIILGVVDGTAGADLIDTDYTGDPEGDRIDNNDAILAGETGNDDIVQAGAGDDTVLSGDGDDEVQGEGGDDTLFGGSGSDLLFGQSGNDSLTGGEDSDSLYGGIGNDTLSGDDPSGSADATLILMQFNDPGGSATAADDSGNGNAGTYQGDATSGSLGWDGDPADKAADLDGSGDYIEIPNSAAFETAQGTFSLRFNADSLQNATLISRDSENFDGGGHFRLVMDSAGRLNVRMQSDTSDFTAQTAALVTPGTWQHVAVTFGPTGMKIFVDGTEVATNSYTGGLVGNSEPIVLGADQNASGDSVADNLTDFFDGQLDEFALSTAVYSPTEIAGVSANGFDTVAPTGTTGAADLLVGGAGEDILSGGGGDDTLDGGANDDTLFGGSGNDTLDAGTGNDSLDGGAGNDTISGGDGDDLILAGQGNDTLFGGAGNDTFTDSADSDTDTIIGGENAGDADTVDFSAAAGGAGLTVTFSGDEAGTYAVGTGTNGTFAEIEAIIGTAFDDIFDASAATTATSFEGGAGDDTVTLGTGDDSASGGSGTDTFIIGDTAGTNTIDGGTGDTTTGDVLDGSGMSEDATVILTSQGNGTLSSAGGTTTFSSIEVIETGAGDDSISGSGGVDNISTGAGNDTIDGGAGDDLLDGGAGEDTFEITETSGTDALDGGMDTDGLSFDGAGLGNGANVTFDGDSSGSYSVDNASASGSFNSIESLRGSGNNDTFNANADSLGVTLDGGGGDDSLTGGSGQDTLIGGAGNDSLDGGEGDDTYLLEDGFGIDTISGGSEPGEINGDTLDASAVTADLTWDLASSDNEAGTVSDGTNTATYDRIENRELGDGIDTIELGGVDDDSFVGFQGPVDNGDGTFAGIDLLDVSDITGADTSNTTVTDDGAGNALLTFVNGATLQLIGVDPASINSPAALIAMGIPVGVGGSDGTVLGTSGDDVIDVAYTGDADGDQVDNNDATLPGDTGNDDLIVAGAGNDTIDAGAGNDEVYGGDGDDSFVSTAGDDSLFGGEGLDRFEVNETSGTDLIDGGEGAAVDDQLDFSGTGAGLGVTVSFSGNESGTYDVGAGLATGSFAAIEEIIATSADDSITGSTGVEEIYAGAGNDTISTAGGNDAILGEAGNDNLNAGAGDDSLYGGSGNDTLTDGSGNDLSEGGAGDDTFSVGSGNDTLFGGDGDDEFLIGNGAGTDTIDGGSDGETSVADRLNAASMTDDLTVNFSGAETGTLVGSTTNISFSEIESLTLGSGNDSVSGSSGTDRISLGDGDDTISSFGSADTVFGGTGNDTIDGGGGADVIDGGAGNDSLTGGTGPDTITGGAGNDRIEAAQGDTVDAGTGDDTITLADLNETATGNITVDGGSEDAGGDTLNVNGLIDVASVVAAATDDGTGSLSGSVVLTDGTTLDFSDIENIICFTTGTPIATPQGARAIETLVPGDLVVTRDHGLQPIRWIGQRTVPARGKLAPIRLRPGVMPGLESDLLVSPQHRMLFQGYRAELLFGESEVLVPAKHLIDGCHVTQDEGGDVTYVHMMFDEHEIVFAGGAATESFHPGAVAMDTITDEARDELFSVFPELRALPESYGGTARRCLLRHEAKLLRA